MATSRSDGAPAEGEVEGEISVRGMPNEAETAALIAVLSGLRSPAELRQRRGIHVGLARKDSSVQPRAWPDRTGTVALGRSGLRSPWVVLVDPEGNEFCVLGAF